MKLLSFSLNNKHLIGIEFEDKIISLSLVNEQYPTDMLTVIESGSDLIKELKTIAKNPPTRALLNKSQIQYQPLISNAKKILCVGLNYKQHLKEFKEKPMNYPTIFTRFNSSIVAHEQNIKLPPISHMYDYEGELVVIIGKRAKNVKKTEAFNVIAGYSIFNDVTVRDYQSHATQWTMGKNFDGLGSFGPVMVPIDKFGYSQPDLKLKTYLNDKIMQDDSTKNMIFPIADLIEYITSVIALEPGDIIVSGTPGGVGYTRNPPVFLKDGDICRVEIENIGILSNKFING
jgi:2-keto-4-pentenoate hydratase/2-oxohepta-3-ene-1,7-dioic acid hydratase in catechol pathway